MGEQIQSNKTNKNDCFPIFKSLEMSDVETWKHLQRNSRCFWQNLACFKSVRNGKNASHPFNDTSKALSKPLEQLEEEELSEYPGMTSRRADMHPCPHCLDVGGTCKFVYL